jgi:fatty-acid desaturase
MASLINQTQIVKSRCHSFGTKNVSEDGNSHGMFWWMQALYTKGWSAQGHDSRDNVYNQNVISVVYD